MNDDLWVAIRDGVIVGTPYGPDVPNGKYMLVERLNSEGGIEPKAVQADLTRQLAEREAQVARLLAMQTDREVEHEKQLAEARDKALEEAAMFIQSADAPVFDYSDGPKAMADTIKFSRIFAAAIRGLKGPTP